MKKLSNKFNDFLSEAGVSSSLFFVMLKIAGVNAYSLHYIFSQQHHTVVSWAIAVSGASAFALPTIVVMHKKSNFRMKALLPVLDGVLMFGGFNLHFQEQFMAGTVNWTAVVLSAIFAVFTAILTSGLGQLSGDDLEETVSRDSYLRVTLQLAKSEENNKSIADITADKYKHEISILDNEMEQMKVSYTLLQSEVEARKEREEELKEIANNEIAETKRLRQVLANERINNAVYKGYYLKIKSNHIKQKGNPSDEDLQILEDYNKFKNQKQTA